VELGLPIWTRFIRVRGATKTKIGELNTSVMVGGTNIATGDVLILDADGGVCVKRERVDAVLNASEERLAKEAALRKNYWLGRSLTTCTVCVHMWKGMENERTG
jgi:4-hydroxy-4-methyl-2-oxoglutarate aldolase